MGIERMIDVNEMDFTLKAPCADCPFKRTTPHHEGVASDLVTMAGNIEMGKFIFSCHKTDPRSDGFKKGYKGKLKHCAGSLIMLKGMGEEGIQDVWARRNWARMVGKLKPHPDVFKNLLEMVMHYADWIKKEKL